MGDFPVDPHLSRCVISAAHRGCGEEVLRIIAMLSVPPPFSRPRWAQKAADRAHKTLASGLGDHLTLLGTYSRYVNASDRSQFCHDHFLQERSMKQAENICKQLRGIARNLKLIRDDSAALTEGAGMLTAAIRKSMVEGFFMQ